MPIKKEQKPILIAVTLQCGWHSPIIWFKTKQNQYEDRFKYEDNTKYYANFKYEDDLKYRDSLKYEDNFKHEDNFK